MAAEILLGSVRRCKYTGKYVVIVDDCDYGWAKSFNWTADLSDHGKRVYAVRRALCADGVKRKVYMHREIWERASGPIPQGAVIDHREHGPVSGLDNRRSNLRLANDSLNMANQRLRADNTSGYKGVSWSKQRNMWEANINLRGAKIHLGCFRSVKQAASAYDEAAVEMFGEYARPNASRRIA